jgi:hypothetical protein
MIRDSHPFSCVAPIARVGGVTTDERNTIRTLSGTKPRIPRRLVGCLAHVDAIRLERHDIDIALASSWMAVIRTSGCAAGDIALEGIVRDVFETKASMGNRVNRQIEKLCDLECVE